jgi:hypothetical protein
LKIIVNQNTNMKAAKNLSEKKEQTPSQKKITKVMHEFKKGELHSGKTATIVTNPKQAIAIALSEAEGLKSQTKK